MKRLVLLISLVGLFCIGAHAQTVNSGSTGADGRFYAPRNIQSGRSVPPGTTYTLGCEDDFSPECTYTVPLREPPNHIYNFTTVNIEAGVTVRFAPNRANTPVFILAQGDVTINGRIMLDGAPAGESNTPSPGGPGGFSGGMRAVAGSLTNIGGAGSGPGGQSSVDLAIAVSTYMTPELQPIIGGSGGGSRENPRGPGSLNGAGGGGALLLASSGVIDLGFYSGVPDPSRFCFSHACDWEVITAKGGLAGDLAFSNSGSGGAIRIVATSLRGNRGIAAYAPYDPASHKASGRIRLDIAQTNLYTGITSPTATFNLPGQPITVFPPVTPTVRIVSIGGVPLPAQPTGAANTPDIVLPPDEGGLTYIEVEALHVPNGTPVKVIIAPQYGAGDRIITAPVSLTGVLGQPKRATVSLLMPASGVGIVSALIDSVVPEP